MYLWGTENKRKAFGLKTKRVEWLKAAGESGNKPLLKYLADSKVPKNIPKSKCRKCKRLLTWGDRSYDFDHKDNNSANNTQSNCYLVCKVCHGKHTKLKVIKEKDYWGNVVGHRTIKLKVGYKKATARKPTKRKKAKKVDDSWW